MRYRQAKKIVWNIRPTYSLGQMDEAFRKVMKGIEHKRYNPHARGKLADFIQDILRYPKILKRKCRNEKVELTDNDVYGMAHR